MLSLSSAQIHLAVNHLPVVGALLATVALALGALTRQACVRNMGGALLLFASLSALPAYFSGEGAEEIVEDRPGVSEALIERHEDAAAQALWVILFGGIMAAAGLTAVRLGRQGAVRILFALALLASLVSTGLMGRVAHLGGQIRHDELRAPT